MFILNVYCNSIDVKWYAKCFRTNILNAAKESAIKYFDAAPKAITEQYGRQWVDDVGVEAEKMNEDATLVSAIITHVTIVFLYIMSL